MLGKRGAFQKKGQDLPFNISKLMENKGLLYSVSGFITFIFISLLIKSIFWPNLEYSFNPEKDPHFENLITNLSFSNDRLLTAKESILKTYVAIADIESKVASQAGLDNSAIKLVPIEQIDSALADNTTYPNFSSINALDNFVYTIRTQELHDLKPTSEDHQESLLIPANGPSRYPILNQNISFALARNSRQGFNPKITFWVTPFPEATAEEFLEFSADEAIAEISENYKEFVFKLSSNKTLTPGQQIWIKASWEK